MADTHHKNKSEPVIVAARNLLLVLAAVLLAVLVLPTPGLGGLSGYLPWHMLMETIAVVTASMIYAIGWHTSHAKPDYRRLAIACLFLGVAILDFSHILSFDGMPDFVTPGSPEKTINFWLMARIFAAAALLCAVLLPAHEPRSAARYLMLAGTLISVLLIHIWFLFFPGFVPSTFDPATGLTTFKVVVEYCLSGVFAICAFFLWRQSRASSQVDTFLLAVSAAIMALSEVFFTVYTAVNDVYALLGHVYKIAAYSLLYRALVVSGIEQPFREIEGLKSRVEATLDALPDMMFEISEAGIIRQYHSNISEAELLAPPDLFLGRNMGEFVPDNVMEEIRQAMADINEFGCTHSRQYSLATKNGLRWYEISGSGLISEDGERRYILVVRDITERHFSEHRTEILLSLASESLALNEKQLATQALDKIEEITQSRIGFLYMVAEDQQEIELLAWSTGAEQSYRNTPYNNHYPISEAGIWADCVRERRQIFVNSHACEKNKKGLPEGHAPLTRFVSVPVFDNNKVRMILGIGNSDYDYDANAADTVQLIGNELYQIIQRRRAQRENERSRRILKAALDHLPIGIAVNSVGDEVRFEYMNDNFPAFYRTTREALSANPDFWQVVYEDPDQRDYMRRQVIEDFNSGDPKMMHWDAIPVPKAGQELRYISAQNVQVPEEGLSISLVVDVTEERNTESELRIAATAFSSQEGIMITGADQRILRVNAAFERVTGYTQEEVVGKTPSVLSSGRNPEQVYRDMWQSILATGGWHGEIWNKRKSGEVYPQSLTITAVKNAAGEVTHYVGDFIDVSDLRHAEQEISRLSYFDSLTGLPNREQLRKILATSITRCIDNVNHAGLLIIDLDHFKMLNDIKGREAGDKLLIQVAERLQKVAGPHDIVARYGGDEFVIVINDLDSDAATAATEVNQKAQYVLAALEDTYRIEGDSYYTTSSIGATLFGLVPATAGDLIKQADIGLSQAKEGGRNQVSFFDPALELAINERAQLLSDLREGIQRHEFELYVQAQQDISGTITGAEALVRWNHPERGLVSPGDFIPLAESSGLMLPLGREITRMGLDILQGWQQLKHCNALKLSLNLAPQQFHEADFADSLLKELELRKLDAGKLMLEFTESTLLNNFSQARFNMQRLSAHGVMFAIDDFGTGYSSLAYLSELPVHQLKIDQSFVRNMATNAKNKAIVRTVIDMAYSMGMEVLAEGVETEAQRESLMSQGCMQYQGYLIGKPQTNLEFIENMLKRSFTTAERLSVQNDSDNTVRDD